MAAIKTVFFKLKPGIWFCYKSDIYFSGIKTQNNNYYNEILLLGHKKIKNKKQNGR